MRSFWKFASWVLVYRRLLALGLVAAIIDAACAFGGFGTLMVILPQFFGRPDTSVRELFQEKIGDSELVERINDSELLSRFIDPARLIELIPSDPYTGFMAVLGAVFGLTVLGASMRFLHHYAVLTAVLRTSMRIRREAFQTMLHSPMERLAQHGSADSLSRIMRDSGAVGKGLNALMSKAVRDVLVGLALLGLALLFDVYLTLIFLLGAPPAAIAIRKFGKRIRRASRKALGAYAVMLGMVQEPMQSLPVVRTHGAEGYERRRFNTMNRKVYRQEAKVRLAKAMSPPVVETLSLAAVLLVATVAAWYVFRTDYGDPGDLGPVLLALAAAGASFKPLAGLNNKLQEAAAAAVRVDEILEMETEPNVRGQHKLPDNAPPLPRHQRDVRFERVSFAYPGSDAPALREVDLTAEHGQVVAVVGPNGSGKTTLLTLLPRLMAPSAGRILIDGHDIAQVSLRSLRRQMALVSQQTAIFSGTIGDNIAYGHGHVPQERIEAAARAAHAHEFIAALPAGYDTALGEGGLGLSGGQKQRLAIARAILRDPPILILDEATSQIDAESEALITDAIAHLRSGRTTFVIAHRLSTVVEADVIAVMDRGAIIDRGTHDELLRRCALYQRLTQTQLVPSAGDA